MAYNKQVLDSLSTYFKCYFTASYEKTTKAFQLGLTFNCALHTKTMFLHKNKPLVQSLNVLIVVGIFL